jgi:sugar phosphate isomerase/epimerase
VFVAGIAGAYRRLDNRSGPCCCPASDHEIDCGAGVRLGVKTDSLAGLVLDEALDVAARVGLECVELATGGWSPSLHVDLERLLESDYARRELLARVYDRGLEISALTCSGNQLDPVTGPALDAAVRGTIALAPLLDVDRVILMSGCPGGPGDRHANWITVGWPPEAAAVLRWQWDEVVIPYWRGLVAHAERHGVARLCVEMCAQQVVYNVPTLHRLRDAAGPVVGANYDPSHLMWMGADPLVAIEALGDTVYHAHVKDLRLEPAVALTTRLETRPEAEAERRAWNYVTPGHGNGEDFWRSFCSSLLAAGYDDVLSIEQKDPAVDPVAAVTEVADMLRRLAPTVRALG